MLKNHSFVILLIIFLSETHPPHTKPLSWLQSLCESHRESIYNYKMCTAPFTWNFELCRRTRPIYSTWNVCKQSISNFRPGLTSPQKVTIDCIVNGVKQSSVGLKYAMWGLSSSMGGGGTGWSQPPASNSCTPFSRFPFLFRPFVSRLPPFIVFLLLSCKLKRSEAPV